MVMQPYHIHLVSDSTGETVGTVARACLVQFSDFTVEEHTWPMVRNAKQVGEVVAVDLEGVALDAAKHG